MALILFIIGLVGVILPEQFSGQQELGVAFLVLAVFLFVVQLIWGLIVAKKVKGLHEETYRRFDRW